MFQLQRDGGLCSPNILGIGAYARHLMLCALVAVFGWMPASSFALLPKTTEVATGPTWLHQQTGHYNTLEAACSALISRHLVSHYYPPGFYVLDHVQTNADREFDSCWTRTPSTGYVELFGNVGIHWKCPSWGGSINSRVQPSCTAQACPANSMESGAGCRCNPGFVEDHANGQGRCVVANTVISLVGASSTKTLLAGPVLPQTARVTQNGAPVPGKSVSIRVGSGGAIGGTTDGNGEFHFTYVPPYLPTLDQVIASCSGCINTAQKPITVETCDVCEGKKGNPISIATGEKEQAETDWSDPGAHPLSLVRHYRSFANTGSGLGQRWSHSWAAAASTANLEATVRFGDGSKVLFKRGAPGAAWVADNQRDAFFESSAGFVYVRANDESRWSFDGTGKLQSIVQRNGWVMALAYNANHLLASVTNAFGRVLKFAYDEQGRLTHVVAPDGKVIGYTYDASSRLAGVLYPDGTRRSYSYEDARWPLALTGITDESGVRYATFGYDEVGRAISTEHAGGVERYTVTYPSGMDASVGGLVAGSGAEPALRRSALQVTGPLGTAQSYAWQGGNGQVRLLGASGAFEGGKVANRTFVGPSLTESETDFLGVSIAHTWDLGRQLKIATIQAPGRPEAQTTTTQWHPSFRLPVLVTEAGRSTAYGYDNLGNKLSEVLTDTQTGQTRTRSWMYNSQGLVETMTDPRGGVWRFAYDSAGNRASVIDPMGRETKYTHDAAGRVLTQASPGRPTTVFTWDVRGRLTSQTAGSEAASYTYAPTGQLASFTDSSGLRAEYAYDAAQRLIGVADNKGASISYTLDAAGNRVREEVRDQTGAIALVTARVINSLNRVAVLQGASGQTTQIGYDSNGEPISETDPLNQTTRTTLDGLRRTTATTFADNTSAQQTWSQLDQLTQVTDPKGVATQYVYNAFGEVMSETSPDIGTIRYTRDADGQVIGIEDAKGQITHITRDALGRPTEIRYAGDHVAFLAYNAADDVTRIEDSSGSTAYERDQHGRILAKTQAVNDDPSSPSQYKLAYGYTQGKLTSVTYPSGLKVSYQRQAGRITGIDVQRPGSQAAPFVSQLTHTALGVPQAWTWSNGAKAERRFDADGRMVASEFASYIFDAASRITGITQTLWASRVTSTGAIELYQLPVSWSLSYDSRNRLASFVRPGAETRYIYDPAGNRLSAIDSTSGASDLDGSLDGDSRTQTVNQALKVDAASNRLLGLNQTLTVTQNSKQSQVSAAVNFTLDANGAMVSDGLRTFEYDAARRLAKVKVFKDGEAAGVSYLHNELGQRVFKSEVRAEQTLPSEEDLGPGFMNWLRKSFGWMFSKDKANAQLGQAFVHGDGDIPLWALLGEYDNGSASGKGTTEYLWLPTEDGGAIPLGMYKGGRLFAIHSDHLGTPRLATDDGNKPVWQWPYSAFGNNKPTGVLATTTANGQTSTKGTKPAVDVPLRDPGQYEDEETGMRHNMHRTYAQKLGRFPQPDPIGMAGGINRFVYGENSPFMHSDPMGLQPVAAAGGAAGGLGLGGLGLGGLGGASPRPVDPTDPYGPQHTPVPGISIPDFLNPNQCPPENECDNLNQDVQRAKDKVGKFQPAACNAGMSKGELLARSSAWLELAVARAKRDQKCWAGGDGGHQQAQADAWANLGRCQRLLR